MVLITGIILAGGASRRMGQDKATLPWGNTTLIQHIVAQFDSRLSPLIVVASPGQTLPELGHKVIRTDDITHHQGPLAGFDRGLLLAPRNQPVFLTGCDFPLMRTTIIDFLHARFEGSDAVVPSIAGKSQPLAAMYLATIDLIVKDTLKHGCRSMYDLLQKLRTNTISQQQWEAFDPGARMLTNVNTLEEYQSAHKAYLDTLAESA